MAVLMPTGMYRLLRRSPRPEVEDAHGVPVPSAVSSATLTAPMAGAVREVGDGSLTFRLDPGLWPVYPDDVISASTGEQYVIRTAKLNANVAASALDYVGGVCVLSPNARR